MSLNEILERLKENARYLLELGNSTWLMHDHRWAFYCWEVSCPQRPCTLVHVDHHWDGCNDFQKPKEIVELKGFTIEDIKSQTMEWDGLFRYDNFIFPAIIRGLVNEVHFLCEQSYSEPGLWPPFMEQHNASQVYHESVESLLSSLESSVQPIIFDLDLDLFNRHSQAYYEKENDLIAYLSNMIRNAQAVTIATSRLNNWKNGDDVNELTWDDRIADAVTENVIPEIKKLRSL